MGCHEMWNNDVADDALLKKKRSFLSFFRTGKHLPADFKKEE